MAEEDVGVVLERICTHSDVTWSSGRGCPLVVHHWADLQSLHGLCCYGNITRMRNVNQYMLVSCTRSVPSCYTPCLKKTSHLRFAVILRLDIQDPIVIIFGRNVTKKVRNQTMLCFPTSLI